MFLARALRLVLAAALLAAWQGALLHPIEHVDHAGGFFHLAGGSHDPDEDGGASVQCDALAAVAVCVGDAPALSFAAAAARDVRAVFAGGTLRSAPPPVYRSQAPPALS